MTRPVVDLNARRVLRRDVRVLVKAHPELADAVAQDRCAEWLDGEEHIERFVEPAAPAASAGRRPTRPASRGD